MAHRNRRIGTRLKLKQREDALERKIWRMEWTFDPLVVKNAYLNIRSSVPSFAAILLISMVYPQLIYKRLCPRIDCTERVVDEFSSRRGDPLG